MFGYLVFGSLVKKVCGETQPCPSVAPQVCDAYLKYVLKIIIFFPKD